MVALPDFQLHTVQQVLELLLSLQWKDKVITLTEEQVELLTCLDIKPGEISRVEAEDKVTINTLERHIIPITIDIMQSIKENISESKVRTAVSNINNAMTKNTILTSNVDKLAPKPVQHTPDKSNYIPESIKQSSNVASLDHKTIKTTQPVYIPTPKLTVSTTEVTSLIPTQPDSIMNIALKKKDDISKIDLVKFISFNTYVQISCPSQ